MGDTLGTLFQRVHMRHAKALPGHNMRHAKALPSVYMWLNVFLVADVNKYIDIRLSW